MMLPKVAACDFARATGMLAEIAALPGTGATLACSAGTLRTAGATGVAPALARPNREATYSAR